MTTPKKGSKPIKITLTENQISDIITQTARTRKGLKAESLEDRIAPSMIGAPLDPSLVPLPDGGNDPLDPEAPLPGLPGETVGDAGTPYNPFLPPPDPSNPPLPGQPLPAGYDPTVAPTFVGGATPQFPGGFGGQFGPGAPAPTPFVPDPNAPPSPFVGSGAPSNNLPGGFGSGDGGFGGQFGHPPELPLENPSPDGGFVPPPAPIGPIDPLAGELPPGGEPLPVDPNGGELPPGAPIVDPIPTPTNDGPSAEELQTHRQNILRQLRGQ
ncbi:MAG TPA: hypothetical protein VFS92_03100 [Planctomycetota bacterium]|nr:hypothetical protein [Planctomycetota bacterium]